MRIEANFFLIPGIFFVIVAAAYGYVTNWSEWVGMTALLLSGGLSLMVAVYFKMLQARHGMRPEDDLEGEIAEYAGEQGVFAPWSWWPLVIAGGAALGFLAMAVGWWIMVPAVMLSIVGLIGWVFEFSVGRHAH